MHYMTVSFESFVLGIWEHYTVRNVVSLSWDATDACMLALTFHTLIVPDKRIVRQTHYYNPCRNIIVS